jgi:hypothetical protein
VSFPFIPNQTIHEKRAPEHHFRTVFLLPVTTRAAEGGGSHFLQGTAGDFAMALVGPPGFYMRNDLFYFEGDMGPVSRGRFILSDLEQETWVDTYKFIYLPDIELLGAQPGIILAVPYVLDVAVSGSVIAPVAFAADGSRSGFGDPSLTLSLGWRPADESHLLAGVSVYSDFGSYSADRIINLGRNYWSFNPMLGYTWLDPERGHEVSLLGGLMFNTENPATDYRTGTEVHLGLTVAQHFSKEFAIGLVGYYYDQVSDDKGALAGAIPVGGKGFRSSSLGAGLAVSWTPKIAEKDVTFIGKWMHDFEATRRLQGDLFMASVALEF